MWRTSAREFQELSRTFPGMLLSRFIPFVLHSVLKSSRLLFLTPGSCTRSSFCWGSAFSRHPRVHLQLLNRCRLLNRSLPGCPLQNCLPPPALPPLHSTSCGLGWFGFYHGAYYLPTNNIVYNLLIILIVCLSLPACKFHKGFVVVVDPTLLEKFLRGCSFKTLLNGCINECLIKKHALWLGLSWIEKIKGKADLPRWLGGKEPAC